MDHLGTDEQFELLTFTLVHAYTAEWSIFRFFFPGGIKKIGNYQVFFLGLLWAGQFIIFLLLYYYFTLAPTLPFVLAVVIFFVVVVLRVF